MERRIPILTSMFEGRSMLLSIERPRVHRVEDIEYMETDEYKFMPLKFVPEGRIILSFRNIHSVLGPIVYIDLLLEKVPPL